MNEWKTKSFLRKANELAMLTTLGAFVGLMATRKRMFRALAWAPDRDNMIGVWDGLANAEFQANMHAVLYRRGLPEQYTHGEFSDPTTQDEMWFDPCVRIADFFATPTASLTRKASIATHQKFFKCDQIIQEVMADNPRVITQSLSFSKTEPDIITPDFRLVKLSKTPFDKT